MAVSGGGYTCSVCGYDSLRYPPENFIICPCCGTQFELHDAVRSHEELRRQWVAARDKWHSRAIPPLRWSFVVGRWSWETGRQEHEQCMGEQLLFLLHSTAV